MRLAVAGGGTGGHIYPAVAVIEALRDLEPALDVVWLGVRGGPERTAAAERGWQFAPVAAAQVRGTGVRAPLRVAASLLGSVSAAQQMRRQRAQALLATGGYVSVPAVVGSRLAGVPSLLFLPDVQPGWAVRFSRRFASLVGTTSDAARPYLGRSRVEVTGYPVRPTFFTAERAGARRRLGLDERPALLVLGGSLGAFSLNQALLRWAPTLLVRAQVLHVAGRRDYAAVSEAAAAANLRPQAGYHLFEYMENLPEAMVACDLVLCRAGASSLGELPAAAKPAILVPYPHSGAHQMSNARYLEREGVALVLEDAALGERLGATVEQLLGDQPALGRMADNARRLARPRAARDLALLLQRLARGS